MTGQSRSSAACLRANRFSLGTPPHLKHQRLGYLQLNRWWDWPHLTQCSWAEQTNSEWKPPHADISNSGYLRIRNSYPSATTFGWSTRKSATSPSRMWTYAEGDLRIRTMVRMVLSADKSFSQCYFNEICRASRMAKVCCDIASVTFSLIKADQTDLNWAIATIDLISPQNGRSKAVQN